MTGLRGTPCRRIEARKIAGALGAEVDLSRDLDEAWRRQGAAEPG